VPNAKLLLDYGFALLDNPHERVRCPLALRAIEDDPATPRRRALLRRGGAATFPTLQLATDDYPEEALRFLRVALADDDALARREATAPPDDALAPDAAEPAVVAYLDDLLATLESDCGPPPDEDAPEIDRLERAQCAGGEDADARKLFALRYRTTRRKIVASVRARLRGPAPP